MVFLPSEPSSHSNPIINSGEGVSCGIKQENMDREQTGPILDYPLSYEEQQNLVVVQVNQGETFTIQNEDGTCRNISGPAFVPMISQNGAIPPIFVPPGYISQVFEENGVKRVVVLPNVASSVMENRQSELPSPTMHNPAYHHPMFHHPAMPHLQFPMNGFHPHAPPSFIPHQNMAMMSNYQQDAMHFLPRPMYSGDGPSNYSLCPPCCFTSAVHPDFSQGCMHSCCQPVALQPLQSDLLAFQQGNDNQKQSFASMVSVNSPPPPPPSAQQQMKVVYCSFNPHSEVAQSWDLSVSESKIPSKYRAEQAMKSFMTSGCREQAQDENLSDSAYSSIRSPSISFQSCQMEQIPVEQQIDVQSSSHSPPGTSSISSSPNSSSSCSSPPASPKKARHSLQNGHAVVRSSTNKEAYKCNHTDSKMNTYSRDLQNSHNSTAAGSSEDERTMVRRGDVSFNGIHSSDSSYVKSIKELLSMLKKPEVRDVKPRSATVIWSFLPVNCTSPFAKPSITFDLHLSSRKKDAGKSAIVYSGTDRQYDLTDLRPATDYSVRLYATCDLEKSLVNGITTFRTPAAVPDAPASPNLQPKAKNFLILRWKAPHDNGEKIVKYHIEVSEGKDRDCLQATQTSTTKQFIVQKLAPARIYVFRLAAENKIGLSSWSPNVCYNTIKSIPPAPESPRIVKVGDKSITLTWNKPSNEVTGYTLEMATDSSTYGFRPVYNGPDENCTVKISPRNSRLQFRLLAHNLAEKSSYSDILPFFTEKSATPPQPRVKGTVKSRSCEIAWESPRCGPGFEVTRYVVEMTSDKAGLNRQVYTGTEHECFVDNLEPVHSYRFRLIYFYNGGSSPPSDALVINTPPAIPGPCSTPFLSFRPKPTSLSIKWDPPRDEGDAIATGYEANCIAICDICKKEPLQAYKGDYTECTIENLLPGTGYSLAVRAVNNIGVGPWSENLEAVTSATIPDQCEAPVATVFGPTRVHLQWTPPGSNGADIKNYKLYWGVDESDFSLLVTDLLVHEFSNLTPNAIYYYHLQAINSVGSGPKSDTVSIRTSCGSPDSVSGLRVCGVENDLDEEVVISSSEINLSWDEPSDNGSKIQGYKIHLTPTPNDVANNIFEVQDTNTCLTNLNPDTLYSVKVCAFNAIGCGCFSSLKTIRTKPLPLPAPVLSCSTVSYSNLTLEWSDGLKVNGDRLYVLQMQDKNGRFSTIYQGNLYSKKVNKLVENTTYNFRLKASNIDCGGLVRLSKVHSFTTSFHLPTVEAPVVHYVTPTSCKVVWNPSNKVKKDQVGYKLHVEDQDSESKKVFFCKTNQFVLEDLSPELTYRIFLSAVRHRAAVNQNSLYSRGDASRNSDLDLTGPPSPTVTFRTVDCDVKEVFVAEFSQSLDIQQNFFKTNQGFVEATHLGNQRFSTPEAGIEPKRSQVAKKMIIFFMISILCSYLMFICVR